MTESRILRNPILPGFNPDPSIVRVGEDYYVATSTFEWFPGVQIHHSRDLQHWRLVTRPLTRPSQLNMLGDADSCGIWAPCLTHEDGRFYLIYTDVKRYGRAVRDGSASLRDTHNYLVTAPRIDGPWSDPVYLNSSGFDPSLFHDDDGKKYLLNQLWDHRPAEQPVRRHRAPGVLGARGQAGRRAAQHLPGHEPRAHRGAASVQAQWLLLPDHGGGRHGLEPRRDDGPLAEDHGPLRAAPGEVHPVVAPAPRSGAAARRPRRPGGNAVR